MPNRDTSLINAPFEQSGEAVFVLDQAGDFRQVNTRFATLLGRLATQLPGTAWLDYLNADEVARAQQHLDRAAAGEIVSYHATVAGAAGPIMMGFQLLPVLTDTGGVAGVYGIAKPLAEPPPTDATLVEREHQLSVIFNNIADITFVLNVEEKGRYQLLFVNRAFEKTTGLPVEKMVGCYINEFVPEPSLSLALSKYREAVDTMETVDWMINSNYPTGHKAGEVSGTPVCDDTGRVCQLVGIVHDLTKQKQVEKALRINIERITYALKAAIDAIYEWDVAADTLHWGEGFEDLFGYKLTENPTAFSKWSDYVNPADHDRVVAGLRRAAFETEGSFWQEEYRFRRADGGWADVFDRGYILRDAGGRPVRMIGAMHDITARKQADEKQRLLTEKLLRQNSDLQQFTYIVSHNLRAPLANALGFSDLLAHTDKHSPVFDKSLQSLHTSLCQLDQVLTDVNDIISLQDEQGGFRPEPVAVAAVCQHALFDLQEALAACGGQLRSTIPEALRVPGSRAYFHSIFYNLISNAIKYRSDARPLQIDIAATVGPHSATTITFGDNGLGFDQAKVSDDIFQLYRRFHAGKAGRGIGLFLVKAHVEAMGGQISVRSQVNEGTQFTLYFSSRADDNLPH